ncbi:sodium/potassium-transporting ATPase subunit alpha [Neodiprion pinetum]|uniref:sodium/potassium-transporting ATPase subunit alpha n=1 Tax=Neodiprion pinetum TaxID=441929 RepID=UPI001EE11F09|nr:sodium/potassium-transporting ATPase subunit alpha-like [Neodiprion pinetum]
MARRANNFSITNLASGSTKSALHIQRKRLTEHEIENLHHELETVDHTIDLQRLCEKYNTNIEFGLNNERAKNVLERDGPNAISPPKITPEYIKFLKCMCGGFATLLWTCAALCFVLYALDTDDDGIQWFGVIIVAICIISGLFAYYQESKNSKIMDSFSKMVPTCALVIREGVMLEVPTEEVVVGDLVKIKLGDKVPADIRIIDCVGLRVENSSITGESEPQSRSDKPTDRNPLESQNVAFFSSYAVAGEARGIVIATGDRTMIGRLAGLTTNLKKVETPIAKEIRHFVHIITVVAIISGFLFFILALLLGYNLVKSFTYLLGIVIANVPEVLLVTVTTSLTLTAKKMATKNCLVKNLEAVETLGSTSTICSDKTGTLTQNKMTVSHLWFANETHQIVANPNLGAERDLLLEKPAFNMLVKAATLCLRAEFKMRLTPDAIVLPIDDWEVIGDASETGILKFCEHIHHTTKFRTQFPKVAEVPFDSSTKFQMSIHREEKGGYIMILKGAPEIIIELCSTILEIGGSSGAMSGTVKSTVRKACTDLGYLGERVLAYCDLHLPESLYGLDFVFNTNDSKQQNYPHDGYRFLGLISLIDPPRPTVPDAVRKCRSAGIKVIMVTGDHPVTAMAIAKKVGIIGEGHETKYEAAMIRNISISQFEGAESVAIVVTGNELRNMETHQLDLLIRDYEEIVFARTSPQQKLLIVESCQRLGEIVAVTGDGVNDSPALRKADIGIAMGITGSDVAKNAADMILMDDNFASIVIGIEEGRLIFDNLKKSIAYTLTSSVPEMLPLLSTIVFDIPLPFVIEMVLCVDIGTDLLPAIALAYEKAESDIMRRAPRNPQRDKLVNKRLISMTYGQIGMIQSLAGFYTYFTIISFYGFFPRDLIGLRSQWESQTINNLTDSFGQQWNYQDRMSLLHTARTGYFISIVLTQMVDLVICKTRRNSIFQQGMGNWFLNFSFFFEMALTAILLYVPGTEIIFQTVSLDPIWFLPCLPFAILLWIYDELRRLCIRTWPGGFVETETYY